MFDSNHEHEDIFQSRYNVLLDVTLDIFELEREEYFSNLHKLQNIANINDDDYNTDGIKYSEKSWKQYDLLLLFIGDNAKDDDEEESSDVHINSIIAGGDTKSQRLVVHVQSARYSTIDYGTISNQVFHKATCEG